MRTTGRLLTAAVTLITLASCGSHSSGARTHQSAGGDAVTVALDETFPGFNINSSANDDAELQDVLNQVWPSVYVTTPQLTRQLDTDLVTRATSIVRGTTQTVTYTINPKAVWSDGVPVEADDFIYNAQAESGNPRLTDVDGKPYKFAGSGYPVSDIRGSEPSTGTCDSGSDADRDKGLCPNGRTVTVTFNRLSPAWQSEFTDLVPAHVARRVGWNSGFNDPKNVLSAGPYEISHVVPGQSVTLVRNPKWWGPPAGLSRITFRFFSSDAAETQAFAAGQVDVISPSHPTAPEVAATSRLPGVNDSILPGFQFEHLDFNERNPYLAKVAVRRALAYATNRPQIIADTVGKVDPGITPLDSHIFVDSQSGYTAHGSVYDHVDDTKARSLLTGLGYRAAGRYVVPDNGPLAGKPLTFTITSTSGDAIRLATEQTLRTELRKIGVRLVIRNQTAQQLFSTTLARGNFDIAEFAWVDDIDPAGALSIYSSRSNYDDYSDSDLDDTLGAATEATDDTTADAEYNQADRILWHDMATLPLYQTPQYVAWDRRVTGIQPNITSAGLTWNAQDWRATGN